MYRSLLLLLTLLLAITDGITDVRVDYEPANVVYDVSSDDPGDLHNTLDRAGLLQNLYGNDPFESSIVLVLHAGAIPFFTSSKFGDIDLIERAGSFAMGEIIQFRVCGASAKQQGFEEQDFPDFIRIVPMADAEIVRLQNNGYAYLH